MYREQHNCTKYNHQMNNDQLREYKYILLLTTSTLTSSAESNLSFMISWQFIKFA